MTPAAQRDAIVIGSGIGGLTAATGFANAGKRVLILERLPQFGGAATVYRHGSLTMEASLHETDGDTVLAPNGCFSKLGLTGAVRPIGTEHFYEVRGGPLDKPILVPHGFDAAEAALCAALPNADKVLREYFRDMRQLYAALHGLEGMAGHGLAGLGGFLLSGGVMELLSDLRPTVAKRFEQILGDHEDAKFALGALLGYFDDDPASLSFLMYGGNWARYLESGGYYFEGGSRALTTALLNKVTQAGGEARCQCTVTAINTDQHGSACGVSYIEANGQAHTAQAQTVFANVAPQRLAGMLPPPLQAAFAKPYERFEPSISLFNVSLGLTQAAADFGIGAFSTFVYPQDITVFSEMPAFAARFGQAPAHAMPPYTIADYGRLDAGIRKPEDLYLMSICGVDRLSWWDGLDEATERQRRQAWIDALIADVDRQFPGFKGAVSVSEIATARTMQSFLGTPTGEVYGFRPTPQRLFSRPPSAATTVKGLYLSSAYTAAGGYAGAMHGGMMASDTALRRQ